VTLAGPSSEAFVSRGARRTSVSTRHVEHFVSARRGCGIRMSVTASTASPTPARSTRLRSRGAREARDNVAFGTPDDWAGLAEPDGWRWSRRHCGAMRWRVSDGPQDRADQGARAADGSPPIAIRSTTPTTRPSRRPPSPPPPASAGRPRERLLRVGQHDADDGTRPRRVGFSVGGRRTSSICTRLRRTRLIGHSPARSGQAAARRLTVVLDRTSRDVPRDHLEPRSTVKRAQRAEPVQGPARR
jgi:hypothetical protein